MALAPSRDLFGVPSSAIIVLSMPRWSAASMPPTASKISPFTVATALQHAFAAIALLVAVAQLHRLMGAGRRAGRHGGAAGRAAFQRDLDFDGGIAAAVEDFAADDVGDGAHA